MRTTDNKKDFTVKLRIDDKLRNFISKESSKKGISMSEYVRGLIQKAYSDKGGCQ